MMTLRTVWVMAALLAVVAETHADPAAKTVLGANESLAAGSRALQAGNYEAGIKHTLRGLQAEPARIHRARALSNLCAGYAGAGQYEQAVTACNEAIELNARNWRAYNNRALALIGLGRLHDSRRDLEIATSLNPDSQKLRDTHAWIESHAPQTVLAHAGAESRITE